MDYFKYDPDRTMALEILFFDKVELQEKTQNSTMITTSGTLFVLYLKDSSRFLLCLNDWKYLLIRRLPVMSFTKKETNTLCYSFPTQHGLCILRFPHIPHTAAIKNFETILRHNSDFYHQNESVFGANNPKQEFDEIQESRQRFYSQNAAPNQVLTTLPTQVLEVEKVRKRDKVKKKIRDLAQKVAQKFSKDYIRNVNLTETKSYDSLKNTSESKTVPHFLLKREVEQAIKSSQDILKSMYEEAQYSRDHGDLFSSQFVDTQVGNKLNRPYHSYQNIPPRLETNPL